MVQAAAVHEAEWGVAKTFNFELYLTTGVLDVDEADGGAEVAIACDEGAETTATNDFVDEGNFYSIAFTAAELQCARATVVISATDTNIFYIETYGHPDAQNPCPAGNCVTFGTAQASTASTIVLASATSIANDILNGEIVEISHGTGAGQARLCSDWTNTTPADTCTVSSDWITTPDTSSKYFVRRENRGILEIDVNGYVSSNAKLIEDVDATDQINAAADTAATDFGALKPTTAGRTLDVAATGEAGVDLDNMVGTLDAAEIATDAIGAAEIAADAIGASELATDAIGAAEIAADAITAAEVADGTIDAATFAAGAIDATAIAADAIGASELATDAIGAAELAAAVDPSDLIAASVLATGTCDSGTTATCVDEARDEADADYFAKGVAIVFTSGNIDGQSGCIYGFTVGSPATMTFRPVATNAVTTHSYVLMSVPTCGGVVAP